MWAAPQCLICGNYFGDVTQLARVPALQAVDFLQVIDVANKPGYYKEYYKLNRDALIKRSAAGVEAQRTRRREHIRMLKSQAVCPDCNKSYPDKPWRMSFDHLPGHEKMGCVGNLVNNGWSWERFLAEIAKCEIVCLLCHADRTQARGISASGNTSRLQREVGSSTLPSSMEV